MVGCGAAKRRRRSSSCSALVSAVFVVLAAVCALLTPAAAVYVAPAGTEAPTGSDSDDVVPFSQYIGLAGRLEPLDVHDPAHAPLLETLAAALARGQPFSADDVVLTRVERAALAYRHPSFTRAQRAALRRAPLAAAYSVSALVGPPTARESIRAELLTDNHANTMVTAYYSGDESQSDEEHQEEGLEVEMDKEEKEEQVPKDVKQEERTFRVATYNVWNYNGDWKRRLRLLGRELCSRAHDAVVVQEVRSGPWRDEALARNGWNWTLGRAQAEHIARECARRGVAVQYVWQPAMTYVDHYARDREYDIEGVAVLTRHRLRRRATRFLSRDLLDSADAHQRVALAALIEVSDQQQEQPQQQPLRMAVISTHWSLSPRMATQNAVEAGALAEEVRREWGVAGVVLAGDLNSEPDSAAVRALEAAEPGPALRDAWTASRVRDARPAVRAQLDEATRANVEGFTWCAVPGGDNVKRCDYVFYRAAEGRALTPFLFSVPRTAPCAKKLVAGQRVCASDHSPLSVSFLIRSAEDSDGDNDDEKDEDVPPPVHEKEEL